MDFMINDPVLRNTHKFYDMTRAEQVQEQMRKFRRAYEIAKDKYFVNKDTYDPYYNEYLMG